MTEAHSLIRRLRPAVTWFKVGPELFVAAGPAAVSEVHWAGGRVFLDLKLHDIPKSVAGAVRSAARLGASMVTLHLAGGDRMITAAVEAARGFSGAPLLLGVYRLTSELPDPGNTWEDSVNYAARRASGLGLDGLIAPVADVPIVRARVSAGFLTVSPAIRPSGAAADDQARVATPAEAARAGTDFVVVGRPITHSLDPAAAAQAIMQEMRVALAAIPA